MTNRISWLARFLPPPSENEREGDFEKGYKYFCRGLTVLLLILVLAPFTIISILSHYQYKKLLQTNEVTQLLMTLEQAETTLERFVSKLQSVIKFVGRDDRYHDLLDHDTLQALFVRLKEEYPDFVDIEVIDSAGIQKSYAGPYTLKQQNYSNQIWYREVQSRGVYISNVFYGFRQVPHFVIAISRKHPGQEGTWVLRVTIDGKTLQRYAETISTPAVDDIFLTDTNHVAQTRPLKYGELGKLNSLYETEGNAANSLSNMLSEPRRMLLEYSAKIVQKTFQGKQILHATIELRNTPWQLNIVKELYLHGEAWSSFRNRLIIIFAVSTVTAMIVILTISRAITKYIKEADKKRRQFLFEAENANKLASIGRLAAGVAHEINNPLAIINQKTGLVQDYFEMTGDFEYKQAMVQALDGIQSSVERCKTITHRLLGFARHTDVKTEEININQLLQEVAAFLSQEAIYNRIGITFDLDPKIEKIFSDRGQLQQVFLNITNNAIDAIGSDGAITVVTKKLGEDRIQVQIIDTGQGMSPEVKKRIFEPFFSTKETGKGTGLGLSISYGILEKLGGEINVQSEVGEGTTFIITLPISHKGQGGFHDDGKTADN
jgi:two-component system NtrC family sensor kinase